MPESTLTIVARLCRRCSRPSNLPTVLPRFGDQPTYHIFGCDGCGYSDWIIQHQNGVPLAHPHVDADEYPVCELKKVPRKTGAEAKGDRQ